MQRLPIRASTASWHYRDGLPASFSMDPFLSTWPPCHSRLQWRRSHSSQTSALITSCGGISHYRWCLRWLFVTSRLGAALSLGAVGIGVSGLFVIHGAPDLALTQLLIETIIVVGFVTGLGHLNRQFPRIANTWRSVRLAVSLLVGVAVMGALAAATASPSGQAPLEDLVRLGVETSGGNNIVNVILTDMRALDTLGEVVVLAVVALGIAALATSSQPTSQDKAPNDKAPDDKASDNKAQQEVAT